MKKLISTISITACVMCMGFVSANKTDEPTKSKILALSGSAKVLQEKAIPKLNEESTLNNYDTNRFELFEALGFTNDDIRNESLKNTLRSSQNDIDKDYIYDRMLNTVDYFNTVEGSYRRFDKDTGRDYNVSYLILAKENPQSYEKVEGSDNLVSYFDGKTLYTERKANTLEVTPYDYQQVIHYDTISLVKSSSRLKKSEDGELICYYRNDSTFTPTARESLFPQERTIGFLSNFNNWEITEMTEFLGRRCAIIKGALTGEYSNKVNTSQFIFWVDVETGILLKTLSYDSNNNLVESLATNKIAINSALNTEIFSQSKAKMLAKAKADNINVSE